MNTRIRTIRAGFCALVFAAIAFGQHGGGAVTGAVTDPSGAAVPEAVATLMNIDTGVQRTARTNSAGIYRFDFVEAGKYNLRVNARGFAISEIAGLVVTVGQTVTSKIKLDLSKTATTVTVESGGVQMVNAANAEISSLIGQNTIQNLPLEVRDATVFVNLVPGSVPNDFNSSTRGAAIDGMRAGMGNFMIDGTDNNDYGQAGRGKNAPGEIPGGEVSVSPDAVQEFRVVTDNFSAEYGRSGGFVTDLVTKSGTNQLHGSAFEYNRNSDTTADDFFSARAGLHDQLIRNQFGGSLGGPIKKDKMFIFGAIESQRLRQSAPVTITGTTTQFEEFVSSGAFAAFSNANFGTAFNCTSPSVPGCSLGPIFQELNSKYPMPVATSNFSSASTSPLVAGATYPVPIFGLTTYASDTILNGLRPDVRFDYDISNKDVLTVHYNMDNYPNTETGVGGDFDNPAFPSIDQARSQNTGISWTRTLSPTMVNEAKMGYLRSRANFPCTACQVPSIGTADALGTGFGTTEDLPQKFTENTFQWLDNVSWVHGRNTVKFGGEIRRTRNGSTFAAASDGLFYMWDTEDLLTDGAFGDMLGLGGFYEALASINPSSPTPAFPDYYRGYRADEFGFYGEDALKATRRVTVTLGLRWDYFGVPHNFRPGIDSNFYDGSSSFNQCQSVAGSPVCFPGDATPSGPLQSNNPYYPINAYTASVFSGNFFQKNSDIWNKNPTNFAPRFGLAWDLFGDQSTILRMGGGIFYDRMYNNIFENMRFNAPLFAFAVAGYAGGAAEGPYSTPGFYSVPINIANFAAFASAPEARQMDKNLRAAYDEQVNFDLQHQFGRDWLIDAAYIGTFGHRLLGYVDVNTFAGREVTGYSNNRINPVLGPDNDRANWFNSNYNALQVSLTKRLAHGFQVNTNYTYSHALDFLSDVFNGRQFLAGGSLGDTVEDPYRRYLEYGNADFNLAQRVVAYGIWDLPLFRSHKYLGGWSYDATFSIQSGQPFSVIDAEADTNLDGYPGDRAEYFGAGSPMSAVTHRLSPADGYIDPNKTAAFGKTLPAAGAAWVDGMMARNAMTGPKFVGTDMALAKEFQLNERFALKVTASAFNVFNHPNFENPIDDVGSPEFGESTADVAPNNSGTGARVLQFAARVEF